MKCAKTPYMERVKLPDNEKLPARVVVKLMILISTFLGLMWLAAGFEHGFNPMIAIIGAGVIVFEFVVLYVMLCTEIPEKLYAWVTD